MNGNLVCLLWPSEDKTEHSLFFGVVHRDEELLAKYEDRSEIDINFTDAAVYPLAINDIANRKNQNSAPTFMVESTGIYLESYYHILKTLQNTNDSTLPFEKYLASEGIDDEDQTRTSAWSWLWSGKSKKNFTAVDVPDYARAPGFHFNLSVLLHNRQQQLLLNVANKSEHKHVIEELKRNGSILDETQGIFLN
jgi:hypothetical protein